METTKKCGRWNLIKLVCDFNKSSSTSDGYRYECKLCNSEIRKEWRNNNQEHVNEHSRNYYANNDQRIISINMHVRLNAIIKRGSYSLRTEEVLGVSMGIYLDWLSINFENGMCFANYGKKWQIDLVIPASAYDLTNEQQLLACFNFRIIRPCLKSENAAKYNFICPFA